MNSLNFKNGNRKISSFHVYVGYNTLKYSILIQGNKFKGLFISFLPPLRLILRYMCRYPWFFSKTQYPRSVFIVIESREKFVKIYYFQIYDYGIVYDFTEEYIPLVLVPFIHCVIIICL